MHDKKSDKPSLFTRIWNDPVGSKLIANTIWAAPTILLWLLAERSRLLAPILTYQIKIPVWLALSASAATTVAIVAWRRKRKKQALRFEDLVRKLDARDHQTAKSTGPEHKP